MKDRQWLQKFNQDGNLVFQKFYTEDIGSLNDDSYNNLVITQERQMHLLQDLQNTIIKWSI